MSWTTPTDFVASVMVNEAALDNLSANLTTGVFRLLAETTLGAPAGTVTFSSIPATFRNLRIIMHARGTTAATFVTVIAQMNADATTANYHSQGMYGSATTVTAVEKGTSTLAGVWVGEIAAASASSSIMFGGYEIFVHDYRSAQEKPVISRGDVRYGGAGSHRVYDIGGMWINTAAITSIVLSPTAGNFETNSRFSLYGEPLI